jgi:hypothetical protein
MMRRALKSNFTQLFMGGFSIAAVAMLALVPGLL